MEVRLLEGGLRLPDSSGSYIAFLFCCRLPPSPGSGFPSGRPVPPFGFALGALGLSLWAPLWGPWGWVGAAFGAPLVPPLAPPWGWDQRRYI